MTSEARIEPAGAVLANGDIGEQTRLRMFGAQVLQALR